MRASDEESRVPSSAGMFMARPAPWTGLPTYLPDSGGRSFSPDASIILIGIRGSGKRSLGLIACTELKWRLVTEDQCFEEVTGMTRADFLQKYGSEKFHTKDVEVCRKMLLQHRTRCVLECGLGSLAREIQSLLRQLCSSHPVVHVTRNMEHIRRHLNLCDPEARLLERGNAAQRTCSNFEYYNSYDPNCEIYERNKSPDRRSPIYSFKLKAAKQDFRAFVRRIAVLTYDQDILKTPFAISATPVEHRAYTHAITIRLSEVLGKSFKFEDLEASEDAVMYKIDLFTEESVSAISRHIALVRRMVKVPIIYEVDRIALANQLTNAAPIAVEDARHSLLLHGLRLGVEFLVIGLDDDDDRSRQILKFKGATKIIRSYHDSLPPPRAWLDHRRFAKYKEAVRLGCDLVRLTQVTVSEDDNTDLRDFTHRVRSLPDSQSPLMAYNIGHLGKASMAMNSVLTPVQRPWQQPTPFSITAREAMRELFDRRIFDPLTYYVIGDWVSQSLAPAMHNTAYHVCGLLHRYKPLETSSVDDVWAVGRTPDFGGASISRPFKVSLCEKLRAKSVHAEAIGAINTLIPLRAHSDGTLLTFTEQVAHRNRGGLVSDWYGDNTDWIGIATCIIRNLAPRNVIQSSKTTALVIGAGGMARAAIYALLQLNCHTVFLYNRTTPKAEQVASHFNSWVSRRGKLESKKVVVLSTPRESLPSDLNSPTIIVSCIPASGFAHIGDPGLPVHWLSSPTGGLVLEMAYKPLNTPFLDAVRSLCKQTGQAWVIVDGLEILPEQGIAQFELMTGRKAPRTHMRLVVEANYRTGGNGSPPSEDYQFNAPMMNSI